MNIIKKLMMIFLAAIMVMKMIIILRMSWKGVFSDL